MMRATKSAAAVIGADNTENTKKRETQTYTHTHSHTACHIRSLQGSSKRAELLLNVYRAPKTSDRARKQRWTQCEMKMSLHKWKQVWNLMVSAGWLFNVTGAYGEVVAFFCVVVLSLRASMPRHRIPPLACPRVDIPHDAWKQNNQRNRFEVTFTISLTRSVGWAPRSDPSCCQ